VFGSYERCLLLALVTVVISGNDTKYKQYTSVIKADTLTDLLETGNINCE